MSGRPFIPTSVDEHIGQRIQLRRVMMGLSQKDLSKICGVTFQQIQKYESAGNRISASRLFELSVAMETPVSFFFQGLPGNMPEPTRNGRVHRVAEPTPEDLLGRNESLEIINLYWKLDNDAQRQTVKNLLRALNGMTDGAEK